MATKTQLNNAKLFFDLTILGMEYPEIYLMDSQEWKKRWLNYGRRVLKALAKDLNLTKYRVWSNPAGPAVTGETTLMGMWTQNGIYLDTATPALGSLYRTYDGKPQFMYRTITNMADHNGGVNRWAPYEMLRDPDSVVELLTRLRRPQTID